MEAKSSDERIWRFTLGAENFTIESDFDSNPPWLPYLIHLDLIRKQLETCWKASFEKYACYLQTDLQSRTPSKTSYFQLVDKILCNLKQSQGLLHLGQSVRVESDADVLVVSVKDESLSLLEVLKFCPGRLNDERIILFVLYQVIEALSHLHQAGLPHMGLKLSNLFLDYNYRCVLGVPDLTALRHSQTFGLPARVISSDDVDSFDIKEEKSSPRDLAHMTMRWVLRQCTNYDYLMYLNCLAGRTKGDPMNSAILPWVTDFTVPDSGLRDLTKTKYHLTKGESQLDANYESFVHEHTRLAGKFHNQPPMVFSFDRQMSYEDRMNELIGTKNTSNRALTDVGGVTERKPELCWPKSTDAPSRLDRRLSDVFQPHHLLDMMPNLAYYTYMARRTPKDVLTRFVRPIYQPNEFPPNMARLYELTPEECIPEFFTDPSVFSSIHADMPDLALPDWCADPVEFIAYHSSVLESDAVSAMLHHWIDLTFGYKLIGEAAVQAKNVHLELSGAQYAFRRTGITCLFRTPHPRRWVPSIHSGAYFGPVCSHFHSDTRKPYTDHEPKSNTGEVVHENDGCNWTHSPIAETAASCMKHAELRLDPDFVASMEQVSSNRMSISASPDSCPKSCRPLLRLPSDYDPLALIRTYEGLCRFLAAETRHPDGFELPPFPVDRNPPVTRLTDLFARDVEAIACLAVELFTHPVVNYTGAQYWSHAERFHSATRMLRLHRDRVPRCLHRGLDLVLSPIKSSDTSLTSNGSPPSSFRPTSWHLLHFLFEFPPYFSDLHQVIRWLFQLSPDNTDPPYSVPRPLWGPLSVALLGASYLPSNVPHLTDPFHIDEQVLSLLYPHMQSAAARQPGWLLRAIQSDTLWAFFYTIGGTQAVEQYLIPLLLQLYRAPHTTRLPPDHVGVQHPPSTLFARRFLRLVLAYVPLDTFLVHVAPHVIHVLLTPSNSRSLSADSESPAHRVSTSTSSIAAPSIVGNLTETSWFTARDSEQLQAPSTVPDQVSPAAPQSLSSLIDEIGLDLRSVDTEDELLDLILDQRKPFHTSSLSACSSRLSTKSHESDGVQFSVDADEVNSPLVTQQSTRSRRSHPTGRSTEPYENGRRSTSSDPVPRNDASSEDQPPVCTQNTIPPVVAATDSVAWLAKRVGPLVTARTLVRYLLTGLTACYECSSELAVSVPSPVDRSATPRSYLPMPVQATNRPLVGDRTAAASLRCLEQLVCVYGVSFVQHVYVPFVHEAVSKALNANVGITESGDPSMIASQWNLLVLARVVAALTLMQQFITYLPDPHLSDHLQDSTLQDLLIQAIRLAGRHDVTFPAGVSGRRAVLYKIVDCIYVVGLRIGFELTRARFTSLFQLFFAMFDRVPLVENYQDSTCHQRTDSASTCVDFETRPSNLVDPVTSEMLPFNNEALQLQGHLSQQSNESLETEKPTRRVSTALKPAVLNELRHTFDSDLARLAYVPFCRLAGGVYIDNCMYNADWIHTLMGTPTKPSRDLPVSCSLPASKSVFHSHEPYRYTNAADNQSLSNFNPTAMVVGQFGGSGREELNLIASSALYNDGAFHLRGTWSEVFQHELDEESPVHPRGYRFHAMRVASFVGHMSRINSIDVFPSEGSFLTTSHDKTVQLWSISDSYNPTYQAPEPASASKVLGPSMTSATNVHELLLYSSTTGRSTPIGSQSAAQSLVARLVYREHRRPVFGAVYLPTYRLVASTDGHLILWDPCTGQKVHSGLSDNQSLTALARCSIPGGAVLCADHGNSVYLVDPRMSGSELKRGALQLASGASLAPSVFARDRVKSAAGPSASTAITTSFRSGQDVHNNTSRWMTLSTYDTVSTQLKRLAIELDPRLCGPSSPAPVVASTSGSAGSLRQLAQDIHSPLVFCGFSSGFSTALDMRNGQVVQAWRAHSDSVAQVGSWKSAWLISSGDRSLAFWHLTQSGCMNSVRTFDHCMPRMVDLNGQDPSSIPGMNNIGQFARYGDQLIVCGPGSTSTAGVADVSSSTHCGSSKASQTPGPSNSSSVTSSGDLLGLYSPSPSGKPSYTALGRIPTGILRGRVTALVSLPQSGLMLAGSTHGHVTLMY